MSGASVAWLAGIVFVFPVIWMVLTSLKQANDVTTNPPVWFFTPTLEHYSKVFDSNITPFLLNSLMASVFSTLLVVRAGHPGGVRAVAATGRQVERRACSSSSPPR